VIGDEPFRLRWSADEWRTVEETESRSTALELDFADVGVPERGAESVRFTFYWPGRSAWEGRDYSVAVT
jgi:glucoamylase